MADVRKAVIGGYRVTLSVHHYPKKTITCSKCHRIVLSEPWILKSTIVSKRKVMNERICWKCVRDWQSCRLIISNYPGIYAMHTTGQFKTLHLLIPIRLFVDKPHGEI